MIAEIFKQGVKSFLQSWLVKFALGTLIKRIKLPIQIIHAAVGGTSIAAFMDRMDIVQN